MPPIQYSSINALEDNSADIYMECTEVLLRITRNILKEPNNPKYRSISLASSIVTNKLLPASGAMQCLFDMGFQEGSDKLILPVGSSLDCVRRIHDELLKRRELRKQEKVCNTKKNHDVSRVMPNPVLISIEKELRSCLKPYNNDFFNNFIDKIINIWRYENISIQIKALRCVPLTDLKVNIQKVIRKLQLAVKKKEIEEQSIDYQELFMYELCKWFKSDFFQWVNAPECTKCGSKNTKFVERKRSAEQGVNYEEVYSCPECNEIVIFPRYNHAEKLLETRRGRCGEWACCFYLICRSLGWDVRYILDETDHVWVEVYSYIKKRWIHCDPCETAIDTPLLYECGWKKNLSYVIAFSKEEIQDVTWRYTSNFSAVLQNRRKCSEEQLVDVICKVRQILLGYASERRREFIKKRCVLELVDLMVQRTATEAEMQGRSSGSLAWRLARGEAMVQVDFSPFVWRPEEADERNLKFILSYITSSDKYILENSNKVIEGWRNGLFKVDSVFRKEEQDWKQAYLAPIEGAEKGSVAWRFEMGDGFAVDSIEIKLLNKVYEKGKVHCILRNEDISISIPNEHIYFTTNELKGSKVVELSVELFGNSSWQHAQLFRQSLSECDKTFHIVINLIRV